MIPRSTSRSAPASGRWPASKVWRFGLMGYSCRAENVMLCLSALGSVLADMGYAVEVGHAEAAAQKRKSHEK